jgi:hypothetical protein
MCIFLGFINYNIITRHGPMKIIKKKVYQLIRRNVLETVNLYEDRCEKSQTHLSANALFNRPAKHQLTNVTTQQVEYWPNYLLPEPLNTVHSCSRQGLVPARFTSERPGSVIPIPKTSTLLEVHLQTVNVFTLFKKKIFLHVSNPG